MWEDGALLRGCGCSTRLQVGQTPQSCFSQSCASGVSASEKRTLRMALHQQTPTELVGVHNACCELSILSRALSGSLMMAKALQLETTQCHH